MSDPKHIDAFVKKYRERLRDAEELGRVIEQSACSTAVLFIDLADSTAMKSRDDPRAWLGHVHAFIELVSELAQEGGGTVVKRIGDEVMVTFDTAEAAELFLKSLDDRKLNEEFRFKIAADFGEAYHFQFRKGLPDDPYGLVVDRCARIAKYCTPGVTLCSDHYVRAVGDRSAFYSLGEFSLKGIPEPEPLFIRNPQPAQPSAEYLEPLLRALNNPARQWTGFRYATRTYTPAAFSLRKGQVFSRPFLLRELLTLPRLPYSLSTFLSITGWPVTNSEEEYLGYYVEWEGCFVSSYRNDDAFYVCLSHDGTVVVSLACAPELNEIIRTLRMGDLIRFSGVITQQHGGIKVDYVEIIEIVSRGS